VTAAYVLVAESDRLLRLDLVSQLHELGCCVLVACDCPAALELVEVHLDEIDIIVVGADCLPAKAFSLRCL
jgi:hypothetical protein